MEEYALDKARIFENQNDQSFCILDETDSYSGFFAKKMPCPVFYAGRFSKPNSAPRAWLQNGEGWIEYKGKQDLIVPKDLLVPGEHNRFNILLAAAMATLFGMEAEAVRNAAKTFPGIAHRLEYLGEKNGVKFYNDTAATIPQALIAAADSFGGKARIICGGTDKNIDFSVIEGLTKKALSLHFLAGTATDKMLPQLKDEGTNCRGPFDSLKKAFDDVIACAQPGETIVLSPGCASFGMFLNEFDRGNQFKVLVKNWLEN
jgi:UDP-N-acetylmuramoylalanine--D-glutamate ligase